MRPANHGSSARTLEAWVFRADYGFPFITYGDVAGGHGISVSESNSGAGNITVTGDSGSSFSASTSHDLSGAWHLIDVTFNGSTATVYVAGAVIGSGPLTAYTVVVG